MIKIKPEDARYIKLGRRGIFEQACIEQSNSIRLSYSTVPHDMCLAKDWEGVRQWFIDKGDSDAGAATRHRDQIRDFYEAAEDILWVTFYKNQLWWCQAEAEVHLLSDGTKERKTFTGWHNKDIAGKPLSMTFLSGQLTSMQGFRGTICKVKSFDYLVHKINGEKIQKEQDALEARQVLAETLIVIIQKLPWKDFELLVDLIFRQAGWQRLGPAGGKQRMLDLDLWSPITQDNYLVQIKSQATRRQFEQFQEEAMGIRQYARCYFVVHSPKDGLEEAPESDLYKLWLPKDIANLEVQYGLADWVIAKAI
jgi:hypothetical protein